MCNGEVTSKIHRGLLDCSSLCDWGGAISSRSSPPCFQSVLPPHIAIHTYLCATVDRWPHDPILQVADKLCTGRIPIPAAVHRSGGGEKKVQLAEDLGKRGNPERVALALHRRHRMAKPDRVFERALGRHRVLAAEMGLRAGLSAAKGALGFP